MAVQEIEVPFFKYIWIYYLAYKKEIQKSYTPLTKKILSNANPENAQSFLRKPQYEAFEVYVFLKEYLNTPKLADLFNNWQKNKGDFTFDKTAQIRGFDSLFSSLEFTNKETLTHFFKQLTNVKQNYANYIFSLTMGTGKTILMALCIFYEFLLACKYPKDKRFCRNALVLAPDTTVLQSLKEIQTFDKAKVFSAEYANILNSLIKFHFLDEDGIALSTMDGSDFNLIISTSQKIILKKRHKKDSPQELLFSDTYTAAVEKSGNADLYKLADDSELTVNQRYTKLTRLRQLGIYVDEAHHAFGTSLKRDMLDRTKETSLRLTIDNLVQELGSAGTHVVACFNFTGTPYIDNHLMSEVVYEYGLKEAIDNEYLKTAGITAYDNVKSSQFVSEAVTSFIQSHRNTNGEWSRYEGILPKIAFFASTIDELTKELKPALEKALVMHGESAERMLVNVGDDKLTKSDDLREFRLLDTPASTKQFLLLVGKGKEGWNCRSLFAVALFRKPKSTIFVLQATMRCLRAITETQQTGQIFVSTENLNILKDELEKNFKADIGDLKGQQKTPRKPRTIYIREKIAVTVVEQTSEYKITERTPAPYSLFDSASGFDFDKYKKTKNTYTSITNINSATSRQEIAGREERSFTELSLVAELSLFLTQHETDKAAAAPKVRWPPVKIHALLEQCTDGINAILEKVNYSNDILYDWVIPELFRRIYSVTYEKGPNRKVIKWLAKEPQDTDENGKKCYRFTFEDDMFAADSDTKYKAFSQTSGKPPAGKKSFNLSGYGFDSQPEKDFFDSNLFYNADIKHIWFTGMLTNGQSDFFVHYIDPDSHTLRSYYPDFLVQMNDGRYFIVEIKGGHLTDLQSTQAKINYARQMYRASNMEYVFIPDSSAKMILQDFITQNTRPAPQNAELINTAAYKTDF